MSEGGHLEMRRMEQLSNTVFGVAMTLLAYQAPRDKLSGVDPQWHDIWRVYGAYLSTLLLSFIVAGMFWYSHQRRLAYSSHAGRAEVIVNLLFLLSIILLPVTCGLYGSNYGSSNVSTMYGLNLFLIASFNAALWAIAVAPRRDWWMLAPSIVPFAVFALASLIGLIEPRWSQYIWPVAFLTPAVSAFAERQRAR
jgi:uncharacterized membrane protein